MNRKLKEVRLTFRKTSPNSLSPNTERKRWFFEVPADRDTPDGWAELLHRIFYNANCFQQQQEPQDKSWWALEVFETIDIDTGKALSWDGRTTPESAADKIPWCLLKKDWEPAVCYYVDNTGRYDALDMNAFCELLAYRAAEEERFKKQAETFIHHLYPDKGTQIWKDRSHRMENIACIREPLPIPTYREPGDKPWVSGPPKLY